MVTDLENRGQVAPKDEGSSTVSAGLTIDKQSQDGYLSYKTESPHSVLTNCYLGTGGCKMTVQNGNRSYVVCNSRELQYVDRVEFSERVNFYRKGVDSRVGPIFVDSEIENKIFKNSEELPLDSSTVKEFNAWMKGYDTYLQQATTQCISNDVVYILMDKLPSTGEIKRNYRRAIDVLFEPQPNEETGELEWIMFYDTKVIDPETRGTNTPQYILKGTQHYMEGGRYYKQRMEAPYTGNCKTSEEPWEKDGEPIDTGSNRMLVTPIVIGGHAEGTLLPEHPSGYEVA
ncbi:MAG: hypothetical protein GY799_32620, partial [Desulfobulbaceae bacterium]|nr:hypothetical protein [Desulfobulbaceae bacterium]